MAQKRCVFTGAGRPRGYTLPRYGGIQTTTMNLVKTTVLLATLTGILVAVGGLVGGPGGAVYFSSSRRR